ncbi:MAG: hypothetical protein JO317_06995 [Verrucomicrobiae bacterium]|nr:hypothetical protein [Verrucomicrobiae bacterium]
MMQPRLGFVVALPNEWKYFRAAFHHLRRGSCRGLPEFRGKFGDLDCVVLLGGVGRDNAAQAARTLVEHHTIHALVSIGYAGALSPELVRGDIVLSAYSMTGEEPTLSTWEDRLQGQLRRVADRSHEHHVYVSPLYTADRIIARPDEKHRIYAETGAEVVDMESFSLFKVARDEQIPFIGIHSVTDTADEDIPALEVITPFLLSRSIWRYPKLFLRIASRPRLIYQLGVLNHDAEIAGRNLSHFLKANGEVLSRLFRDCIQSYPKTRKTAWLHRHSGPAQREHE